MGTKVLFIGLDAAEPSLIEKWTSDGSLPILKSLMARGQFLRVGKPEEIVMNPWLSFYSGLNSVDFGLYHYLNWDPVQLKTKRITPEEIGLIPFWRKFDEIEPRTIAIDLPMTSEPDWMNGIEINGFASHEILAPFFTYPRDLKSFIRNKYGSQIMESEKYGVHTGRELINMKNQLIALCGRVTQLAKHYLLNDGWDLFMVTYGAIHRAGHKLWDLTSMVAGENDGTKKAVAGALKEIYQACDRAVGELIELVDENTVILVGSLHGMGPNTSRIEIFPEMLTRVLNVKREIRDASHRPALSSAIRNLIPLSLRQLIKHRLPLKLQDFFTSYWRMGGIDWKSTPAFSLVGDTYGLVRINLAGREAEGIVHPGSEYEYWLDTIDNGLRTFVDAESKRPVVSKIVRRDQYAGNSERFEYLPDLIVLWNDSPSSIHRAIYSPEYGSICWPTPYHHPDGRSGNHLSQGFLIAAGEKFLPRKLLPEIRIQDITATIIDLLGLDIPIEMIGKSIVSTG